MTETALWFASAVYFAAHMTERHARTATALSGLLFLCMTGAISQPREGGTFMDAAVFLISAILLRRAWLSWGQDDA